MANILLVDDDPHMGVIVRVLCRRGQHTLQHAPDAQSALDRLRAGAPDLALVDVNLGGTSGVELCRHVRSEGRWPGLKLALFVNAQMVEDMVRGTAAGAEYVVHKDLVSRSADWLERVGEILRGGDGRVAEALLGCSGEGPHLALSRWLEGVNRALDAAGWPPGGEGLQEQAVRRALEATFGTTNAWVCGQGGHLVAHPRARREGAAPPEARGLLASLAGQVWRLLGTEASVAFGERVAGLAPGGPAQ